MTLKNEILDENDKKIENEDKLIDYKNIFKEKIEKSIGEKNNFHRTDDLIKKSLSIGIKNFLKNENFGIFEKYKDIDNLDLEEKLKAKIDKYYNIHEQILFKVLNKEIDELEEKNINNIKNIIENIIKKYAHIIFIFSEKIKLSDLEKTLSESLNEISFTYASAAMDIENLDNFGDTISPKLKERFDIDEKSIFVVGEKFLSYMYRRLYKEIELESGDEKKGVEIGKKIENELNLAFKEIFYIFETWIEIGFKDDEKLKNLQILTRKIIEGIFYLKKENIAFKDLEFKNSNRLDIFIERLKKDILSFLNNNEIKSAYKNEFATFLKSSLEDKEKGEKTKQNLILNLKEKTDKIAKSRIPEKMERLNNLDIEKIDFPNWIKIPESQKYENVFSKVIAKNGKLELSEFLELKNEEKFNELIKIFSKYYSKIDKSKKIKKDESEEKKLEEEKFLTELIKKQFEEIKALEGIDLEKFIKQDINNLNLLIIWWRFILKIRFLEKNNLEINLENLINRPELKEKEYGVIEQISEKLRDENIDLSENIIFSIDGKVRNTSAESEFIGIEDFIKGLRKGFIDLSKEKIKLTNGEEKIIGSIQDLYIPLTILQEEYPSLERDISGIETYLDSGIDFCYRILKNKEIPELTNIKTYGNILIANKIINSLDEKDFSIQEKEKLQHLAEILKFIKNRIKLLEGMLETAQNDKKVLEKNEELKKLLSGHKKSSFGPAKAFNRAFIKLIGEYGGDFNKLGDLTRLRIVSKNLDESILKAVDFIKAAKEDKNITNLSIVDSTGEPISIPKKNSGYRDIKIFLKLRSGNTVEVQFQIEDMYEIKDLGLDLNLEKNDNIFEKLKKEGAGLTKNDLLELLEFSKERNIKLPTKEILEKMMVEDSNGIDWDNFEEILEVNMITTDYSYHIVRQLNKSNVKNKLTRLERILSDSAWSKIVIKYLKNKNIEIK